MTELDAVRIPNNGEFPFILVTDENGERGLIRAYDHTFSHRAIHGILVDEIRKQGKGLGWLCTKSHCVN